MLSVRRQRVLYVTYDAISEPLGQSQVLAYLEKIAQTNYVHLISFEKEDELTKALERGSLEARMRAATIIWHPLRYHKWPSFIATFWDIIQGTLLGLWLVVRHRLRILHARSYVPSVMALIIKSLTGTRFVFDMRGFWADERVDGGLWSEKSVLFRLAKWFEKRFLIGADHVVSLTHTAVDIMKGFAYLEGRMPEFTVIPTCTNLSLFSPSPYRDRNGCFVLGYVGTVGTWYMFDEVVATFVILLRIKANSRLLVVNRNEHDFIRQSLVAAGVPLSSVEITSASHSEIPEMMARMNAGIFFIKPVYSKKASAPTKLGEFLGCGIPCLGNAGVGDMAEVLEADRVGVVIKSFDEASLIEGLTQLLNLCADPKVSGRCVFAANRHFSLDEGVARYERIYSSLGV